MSLFSFGFSSSKRGATESRSETESQSTDADCPAGQPSASAERPAAKKEDKSAGLETSAAIRPFATKKSRLASDKIHLVHSLATESCRLADRLSTKPFLKADSADADRT